MGEFGRSGPQLPHDEAAQREHLKEVEEDLRRDHEADRLATGRPTRPTGRLGYGVVLVGAVGFLTSCFVPYYGGGGSETVSLYQQGSLGSDSLGWHVGSLLFLFGGVATVALLALAGVTRRGPRTVASMLAATVVAWSLTWTGLMIREATFGGLGITLEWGFWLHLERRRGGHRDRRRGGYCTGRSAFRGRVVARPPVRRAARASASTVTRAILRSSGPS
jgi:hypothetical protein